MAEIVNRSELIDYLLRRQFGSLAPPSASALTGARLDAKIADARWKRDLSMRGRSDAVHGIELQRAKYEAMPSDALQTLADKARNQDADTARELDTQAQSEREARWPSWANKDLWSEAEFAALCCGFIPDERGMSGDPGKVSGDDSHSIAINRAAEDIRRGTLSGALSFISRDDGDRAAIMYGTARHYVPVVAAEWAASRFDAFPASLLAAVRQRAPATRVPAPPVSGALTRDKPLSPKREYTLYRIIAALAKAASIEITEGSNGASLIAAAVRDAQFDSPDEKAIRNILKEVRKQ